MKQQIPDEFAKGSLLQLIALKFKQSSYYRYVVAVRWEEEGKSCRQHTLEIREGSWPLALALYLEKFASVGGLLDSDADGWFSGEPTRRVTLLRTTDPRIWLLNRKKAMTERIEPWLWGFMWGMTTMISIFMAMY